MKKLLFIAILFFSSLASAGFLQMQEQIIMSKQIAVCTTANDSSQWTPIGQSLDDGTANATWVAQKIVLGSQITVTMYQFYSCDNSGSDTGSQTLLLMDHDAVNDYPDETSEVANSSINLSTSILGTCDTQNQDDYALASPLVVAAGTYWVVAKEIDSANTLKVRDTSSIGDRRCYSTDAGTNWTCSDDSAYNFEVWGCTP